MVGNYLGTYTKRHALGVHLSNLVIRSNTVPFKLSCSLWTLILLSYATEPVAYIMRTQTTCWN